MVVISWFILAGIVAFVMYWLGRGVRLNNQLGNASTLAPLTGIDKDAIVNLDTGEVVEPGSPAWRAIKDTHSVRFE